jgi:hypothetical protein
MADDSFIRLDLRVPARRVRPPVNAPFAIPVVGESHYQDTIEEVCGGRTPEGADRECEAELIPEDDNRYDANAVRVEIDGRTVGYLARPDAVDYRRLHRRRLMRCPAVIRGGWDRGVGDRGSFGVCLDLYLG